MVGMFASLCSDLPCIGEIMGTSSLCVECKLLLIEGCGQFRYSSEHPMGTETILPLL